MRLYISIQGWIASDHQSEACVFQIQVSFHNVKLKCVCLIILRKKATMASLDFVNPVTKVKIP